MKRVLLAYAQKLYLTAKVTLEANFLVKKDNMSALENLLAKKILEKIEYKRK